VPVTEALATHLDLCLQCRACETACPSGVRFGRIMEAGRALVLRRRAPPSWRVRAFLLRHTVARPERLRFFFGMLRMYQRSGLQWLVRRSGLLRLLPRSLAMAEESLPRLPARPFMPDASSSAGSRTVALLTGCVMPHLYPRAHEATVRVLRRLGFGVVAPREDLCCGALSLHAGDVATAMACARRVIDAFDPLAPEAVLVNAAGCGATMKEYGELLADDPAYEQRARAFAASVRDAAEFVAACDLPPPRPLNLAVTYQDSCHLAHAQGVRDAPRKLLRTIPGLELREMETPGRCCGSAGVYSIAQPAMSLRLLDEKMRDVRRTGAQMIVTANPGCMMQLELGARRAGIPARVVHVMELLDEALPD
ncbi:MAG TPA: heterodisulfide reductase-related iron-sulfur binding cluster, partial [Dehalococcoidia bacterium]|nr:heterodisulfide reductase-related iron-sulfur binding cluster [Dehalococcoidia bacterium]